MDGATSPSTELVAPAPAPATAPADDHVLQLAIAHAFLAALQERNWPALASVMDGDVSWSMPGLNRLNGTAQGVGEVVARSRAIIESDTQSKIEHVLAGANGFTIIFHDQAKRGNKILDEHLATVFETSCGRVTRISNYLSEIKIADDFFQ